MDVGKADFAPVGAEGGTPDFDPNVDFMLTIIYACEQKLMAELKKHCETLGLLRFSKSIKIVAFLGDKYGLIGAPYELTRYIITQREAFKSWNMPVTRFGKKFDSPYDTITISYSKSGAPGSCSCMRLPSPIDAAPQHLTSSPKSGGSALSRGKRKNSVNSTSRKVIRDIFNDNGMNRNVELLSKVIKDDENEIRAKKLFAMTIDKLYLMCWGIKSASIDFFVT